MLKIVSIISPSGTVGTSEIIGIGLGGIFTVKTFVKLGYTHSHTSGDHAILQKANAQAQSVASKAKGYTPA